MFVKGGDDRPIPAPVNMPKYIETAQPAAGRARGLLNAGGNQGNGLAPVRGPARFHLQGGAMAPRGVTPGYAAGAA